MRFSGVEKRWIGHEWVNLYNLYLQSYVFFHQRIFSLVTEIDSYCKIIFYLFTVDKKTFYIALKQKKLIKVVNHWAALDSSVLKTAGWFYCKTFNKDFKAGCHLLLFLERRTTRKNVSHTKYQPEKKIESTKAQQHNGTKKEERCPNWLRVFAVFNIS